MAGRVPEFSLTSEEGTTVTRANLINKVTIADFIFTSCAGICPTMSTKMSQLQTQLKDNPLALCISFSVDPEADTPEILKGYGENYGAINGRWMFLTGNKKEIYTLSRNGFHLGLDVDTTDTNAIIHSQKFVLIDRHAVIRGYYDSDDESAMTQLVLDTKSLTEHEAND